MIKENKYKAIILIVGDRFFSSYKNKRVQTAWSFAGAQLFAPWREDDIVKVETILAKKGYDFKRKTVEVK